MAGDEARPANSSRRNMLRWAALGVAGTVIVLLGSESLLRPSDTARGEANSGKAVLASLVSSKSLDGSSDAQSVKVKAVYLQMTQYISTSQEYFVLQSPASFGDLLRGIFDKYPILSTMVPNMMILLDGTSTSGATVLKNGDEVDFIPAMTGG